MGGVMTWRLLGGLVAMACVIASQPAISADQSPRVSRPRAVQAVPYYDWTGCYVGAHFGGAYSNIRWFDDPNNEFVNRNHNPRGWVGGGQVGCNLQYQLFVIGVEGQAGWAEIGARQDVVDFGIGVPPAVVFTGFGTSINVVGSAAARVGVTVNHTLFYAKGGAAFLLERHRVTNLALEVAATDRYLRWGWMVGGGFEWGFWGNWSTKIEYNYMDFGSRDVEVCAVPAGACENDVIEQRMHLVKFGLNYRWGGGPPRRVVTRY